MALMAQSFSTINEFAEAASRLEVSWSVVTNEANFRAQISHAAINDTVFGDLHYERCRGVRGREEIERSNSDYMCLTLLSRGEIKFSQNGMTMNVRNGDVFIWDGSSYTEFECMLPAESKIVWIPSKVYKQYISDFDIIEEKFISRSSVTAAVMGRHIQDLYPLLHQFSDGKKERVLSASLEFLLSCLPERAGATRLSSRQHTLLAAAKEEIEFQIGRQEITPASIANAVGVGVRHLHRVFAGTGQSLMEYVTEQRLDRACKIMSNRQAIHKITDVAHQVGFYDASHFNRAFKRKFGVAPSQYKRL